MSNMFNYKHMDVVTNSNMSLEEIHIALEGIAVEGFIGDIIEKAKDIYRSLHSLSGVKEDHALKDLVEQIGKNNKWLAKYDNSEIIPKVIDELGKVDMVVMPGFKGDLVGYSKYLTVVGNELSNTLPIELEKFITLVGHYLTNTGHEHKKLVLKSDYEKINKLVDTTIQGRLNFFHSGRGIEDTLKYRELVTSYREIVELNDVIYKVSVSVPFKNVMIVDSLITKLVTVLDAATEASNDERYDRELLRTTLSEYTLALARMCELYSLTRYQIESCIKVYDNLVNVLIKRLK